MLNEAFYGGVRPVKLKFINSRLIFHDIDMQRLAKIFGMTSFIKLSLFEKRDENSR